MRSTNETLVVPYNDNESLDHWVLKLMAVRMLALDGYPVSHLTEEKSIILGGFSLRADLLAEGGDPPVWIECLGCQRGKLKQVTRHFRGRIIHVDTFWWASAGEIAKAAEWKIQWFHTFHSERERPRTRDDDYPFSHEEFDPISKVEHWHCDLRSPPLWGVSATDGHELVFLEEDELKVRPLCLWSFLWVKHSREQGRKPYEVEVLSSGESFVPSRRFLLHPERFEWGGSPSPTAVEVLHRHGRDAQEEYHLGYVVELLLSWDFPSQGISIRRRIGVGGRHFVPYVVAEGLGGRIWIERIRHVDKLNYIACRFDGKVLVLDEMTELGFSPWLSGSREGELEKYSLSLPVGTEHWHTHQGVMTGWGVSRSRKGHVRIFRTADTKSVPWLATDLLFSRYGLTNFQPKVRSFGIGRLSPM